MRLFRKRTVWLPTWPVFLLGSVAVLLLGGILFFSSHGFLAVNDPSPGAEVLVVEAWITDSSMAEIAALVKADGSPYTDVWLTGPPLAYGYHLSDRFKTFAEMGAASLQAFGVPDDKIHVAPASDTKNHRTYSAGAKLRDALQAQNIALERFDLATLDVHARRSRLVYRKLFPDADIGIIALPPAGYDADGWYKTSSGMKNTIFEVVAYLYEKLGDGGR